MDALQTELAHLIALMAPPYRSSWDRYCWAKANILAESNPVDYASLPQLLKEVMQPKSSASVDAGTQDGKFSTGGS